MPFKTTVQVEGKDVEVEIPDEALAEQFVPFGKHNSEMARLRNEAKGRKTADELLQDPAFKETAVAAWGLDKAKPPTGDELVKARKAWEAEALPPLTEKLKKSEERISRLQQRQLEARILEEAAARGVKKAWLQRDSANGRPRIVKLLDSEFGYSEEHDEFFQREGDGFAFAASGKYAKPYRTVAEFFDGWAADKANSEFLEDTRQRGPGLQQPGNGGGGAHQISREDAKDVRKYRAAKEAAIKAGVELQIVDA